MGSEETDGRLRARGKGYTVANFFHPPKQSAQKKFRMGATEKYAKLEMLEKGLEAESAKNAKLEMLVKGLAAIIRNTTNSEKVDNLISACGIDISQLSPPADDVAAPKANPSTSRVDSHSIHAPPMTSLEVYHSCIIFYI